MRGLLQTLVWKVAEKKNPMLNSAPISMGTHMCMNLCTYTYKKNEEKIESYPVSKPLPKIESCQNIYPESFVRIPVVAYFKEYTYS